MKKLVLAAAAAATFAMVAPAAAQSVSVGISAGEHRGSGVVVRERSYHRGDRVVIHSRAHMRPRADRVVIVKKRPYGHAYGWDRPHHKRTVIIER